MTRRERHAILAVTLFCAILTACTGPRQVEPVQPTPCPHVSYKVVISQGDSLWFVTVHDNFQEIHLPRPPAHPIAAYQLDVHGPAGIKTHVIRTDTAIVVPGRSHLVDIELLGTVQTLSVHSDTSLAITGLGSDEWIRTAYRSTWNHQAATYVRVEPFSVRQAWYRHDVLIASLEGNTWTWHGGSGPKLPADVWERLDTARRDLERRDAP